LGKSDFEGDLVEGAVVEGAVVEGAVVEGAVVEGAVGGTLNAFFQAIKSVAHTPVDGLTEL